MLHVLSRLVGYKWQRFKSIKQKDVNLLAHITGESRGISKSQEWLDTESQIFSFFLFIYHHFSTFFFISQLFFVQTDFSVGPGKTAKSR